jgi:hypothetical protein
LPQSSDFAEHDSVDEGEYVSFEYSVGESRFKGLAKEDKMFESVIKMCIGSVVEQPFSEALFH